MPNDPFYGTKEWRKLRAKCVYRAGYRCEWCGTLCVMQGSSRVDHIETRKARPDLALELSNLRLLCTVCDGRRHAEKGYGGVERPKTGADGWPSDPAHHWNRKP